MFLLFCFEYLDNDNDAYNPDGSIKGANGVGVPGHVGE
jgi:hypothetical protein